MDDWASPPGRISRKPVPSGNYYAPSNFTNVPLTSSFNGRDGPTDYGNARATHEEPFVPLMNEGGPRSSSNEGKPEWNSQTVEAQSNKYVNKYSTWLGAVNGWKVEVACCFLGIVSLVAIAATLVPFENQPLPQLPYDISLNSLISLYVILLKAAMFVILCQGLGQLKWTWFGNTRPLRDLERFDEASRGPVGAFKLIWAIRGRNFLTTFRAVITIIAIAIDPFAQQIVRYSPCEQISFTSNASIPRTNQYINGGIHIGANLDTVDLGLQSAVNVGVFSPSSVATPFTCPTGNCTFPQYRSLGFCSTCKDISSEVVITMNNETIVFSDNTTSSGSSGTLNFTLPSGLWASPMDAEQFSLGTNTFADPIQALLGDSNGPYMNGNESYLTFACDPAAGLTWGCRGYGAAECSLSLCIKTYNASIQNGKLIEQELYSDPGSWNASTNTSSSEYTSTIDMSCLNDAEKQTLQKAGYEFNETTKWLGYFTQYPAGMNASDLATYFEVNSTQLLSILPINPACIYQTTTGTILSIGSYLGGVFKGHAGEAPETLGGTSDFILAIFNSGNVSDVTIASNFKNISNSMTNYVRQNGQPLNSPFTVGKVLLLETCVHVRWEWLTFPAALFALTLIFFVGMVIQTTSRYALSSGSHDFKSYALSLVFCRLETDLPQRFYESRCGMDEMAYEARQMHVRLSKTESGWKFVKDD
ncbi:hypothetical protein BDZ45DRAFT_298933 [Acephala macrosclerotiorum]|nr:hypothetical protein BDZ45DRAFT_298933 [Acephala macrosclerotiorum]